MPSNDERVVSMQFDNKQFEKGVAETSKSIDNLKKKMDFSKLSSGLKTFSSGLTSIGKGGLSVLQKSAEKTVGVLGKLKNALSLKKATSNLKELGEVSLSGLQTGLMSVGEKLDSLGSLGEMAMYRVKNAILDAAQSAIQFGKSLSIDQINAGLGKYEQKISSIKTISNATGLDAEAVNSQLDRLNWFTDETSASFSEMVNNIGKFTSVGRGLDESITAMQGISTWGYHSGASVAEQTRAMYNLSQALGTGSVKLMDWKSIENAGMATKEFKEQAIAAAEAAGTLTRKGDKLFTKNGKDEVTTANFNSTLAKGWFTSDVLMNTLEEYGGFATKVRAYQEKHPAFSLASDAIEQMDLDRLGDRLKLFGGTIDSIAKKTGKDAKTIRAEWTEIQNYANSDEVEYEELESKLNKFSKSLGISMDEVSRINKIVAPKEREKEIKKWAETLGIDVKEATKLLTSLAETEESLGEKAFKSSQQAKSFTEALDATKDAVSTQWMNSFQIIFGGLDDSIALWSDVTEMLWDIFASGGDNRNNMLTHWAEEFAGRDDLFGEDGVLHSVYDVIMAIKETLGGSFTDTFFPGLSKALKSVSVDEENEIINGLYTYDELIYKKKGSYMGQQLKQITTRAKEFSNTIRDFFTDETNIENIGKIFVGLFSVFQGIGRALNAISTGIGNFLKESGAAARVLEIFGQISDKVFAFFREIQVSGGWREFSEEITATLMGFDGLLDDINLDFVTSSLSAIFSLFKGGWKFVKAMLDGISKFLKNSGIINKVLTLVDGFAKEITAFMDRIEQSGFFREVSKSITSMLTDVSSLIDDIDLSFVSHVLDGIFAAIRGIAGFIKPIVSGIARGLKKSGALKTLSDIVTKISDSVKKFFNTIRENGDLKRFEDGIADLVAKFAGLFEGLDLSGLDSFLTGMWALISNTWEFIKTIFGGIIEFLDVFGIPQAVLDFFGTLGSWFTWLGDKMKEFHVWEDFSKDISSAIGKVKEVFDHFKEEIGRFLEDSGIAAKFREWKEKLKQWLFPDSLDENGELQGIAKIFQNIRNSFNEGIEKLKNAKVYDWLMEKWQWLKDSGIIQGLKDFWNAIKGLFGGGDDAKEAGQNAEEGEKAVTAQGNFFDTVKNIISKIDLGSLTGALIGFGAIFLAFKVVAGISGLIKKVTKVVEGVGEVISGIGDITGNFAASLKKSTKWAQIGVMVAAIGAAIWMIADSVSKLGQLSTDQLIQGGVAMIVCAGVLVGIIAVTKKLSKNKAAIGIKDLVGLIIITMMLGKLADTVVKLGSLSTDQALVGIAGLAAIMGLILIFMKLVRKIGKVGVDMGFLFTIGDAMIKLATVVEKLGALPTNQLVKGIAGLAAMMLMLGVFMKATSQTINKKYYKTFNAAGFMKLIGTAVAIWLLSKVLMSLSEMSWEQIGRGLVAMAGIMLLLGVFMRATTKNVRFGEFSKNTAGFFKMIGIAIVMLLMASVLKKLGDLSWEQIGKGLAAMAGVMLILGIFMKATTTTFNKNYYSNKNQAGFFKLIGTALTIMILASVLKQLAELSWEQIGKGLTAMAGIMLILGVFIKVMTKTFSNVGEKLLTRNQAGFFKLIGIALTLVIVGHVFEKLANLEWTGIAKGIVTLAAIMAMMLIFIKSTGKLSIGETAKSAVTFGVMIGLGIAVTMFALSLRSLASLPLTGILKGVIGLSGILLAVGLFMKATSKLTTAGGLLKGLLVLLPIALAMGAFVVALQFIKDIDPGIIAAFGVSFGVMVASMTGMMAVIAIAGAVPMTLMLKGALAISACMVIIIGVATAIVAGLGALANIAPGFKKALESGVEVLGLIGKAFGALIGEFLGGILGGIAGSLPKFAEGIEAIGKGVKSFSESISGIKGISNKDRDAAFSTILALVGIAWLLPRKGGLMQMIFGQGDLGEFAKDIGDLGKGLKSFSSSIKGLSKSTNPEDMKAAMTTATDLAEFAKYVTDPGSLGDILRSGLARFFGVNTTFESFISQIEPFGKSLSAYSKAIKGIEKTSGSSEAAINIAEDILEFKNRVEDPGTISDILLGWFGNITGQKTTFEEFINQIEPFGNALKAYAGAIGGFSKKVSEDDSNSAIDAAKGIKKFADNFKANSFDEVFMDAIENIFGGGDYIAKFERFNQQIAPFGTAIKTYAETISGFSTTLGDTDADSAIAAATGLQKFAQNFGSNSFGEVILTSIDNLFGGGNYIAKFDQFTKQMPTFGEGLKAYASGISEIAVISADDRASAMEAATGLKEFAESFGDIDVEGKGLFASVVDSVSGLFSGGKTPMDEFKKFAESMVPFGQGLSKYADGIKDIATLQPGQADSAIEVVNAVKAFAETLYTDAHSGDTWFDDLLAFSNSVFGTEDTSKYGELGTFGDAMKALGEGIGKFAQAAGTVETGNSEKAIAAVNSIAELAKSELLDDVTTDTNGLWGKLDNFFNGSKIGMLNSFATDMSKFGEAISNFASSLESYPEEELPIDRTVKAVKDFAKALNVLTGDDTVVELMGFNGKFIDFFESMANSDERQRRYHALSDAVNDMGKFGTNIKTFSDAIKDYESPPSEAFEGIKQTLRDMSDFAKTLFEAGYAQSNMVYSISSLAEDIAKAAPMLKEFVRIINGTSEDTELGSDATTKLEKLDENSITVLNAITGIFSNMVLAMSQMKSAHGDLLTYDKFYNLEEIGKGIIKIGEGLSSVFGSLSSLTEADLGENGKLNALLPVINVFKEVAVALGNMPDGGWGYNVGNLGDNVKNFFDKMSQVKWDSINVPKLNEASTAVTMMAYAAARLKEAAVTSADLSTMSEIMNILLGFNGTADDQGSGESLAHNFIANFCTALTDRVTSETGTNGSVYISGHNLTIGFANGMVGTDAISAVAKAAKDIVQKAITTMQETADEASPSKITQEIGYFMSKGMALGLGQDNKEVEDNASSAAGLALSAFWAALNGDMDEQPTITPVVDLTNVEGAAEKAGVLFSGGYNLDVNTSAGMAGKAGRNSDSDVNNEMVVNVDTTNIASTIETMNTQLINLATQMTNLKVVMNSGVLVGQIAPQMDRELGKIANRNSAS